MSSPQTRSISTILLGDGWVLLQHGGGRTVRVGALIWLSNSPKATHGLVGEGSGGAITRRLVSPSAGGKVGKKAHGEEVVTSTWEATLFWVS